MTETTQENLPASNDVIYKIDEAVALMVPVVEDELLEKLK
jgi:hypothetical protein